MHPSCIDIWTKARENIKELICWFTLHSPSLADDCWPGETTKKLHHISASLNWDQTLPWTLRPQSNRSQLEMTVPWVERSHGRERRGSIRSWWRTVRGTVGWPDTCQWRRAAGVLPATPWARPVPHRAGQVPIENGVLTTWRLMRKCRDGSGWRRERWRRLGSSFKWGSLVWDPKHRVTPANEMSWKLSVFYVCFPINLAYWWKHHFIKQNFVLRQKFTISIFPWFLTGHTHRVTLTHSVRPAMEELHRVQIFYPVYLSPECPAASSLRMSLNVNEQVRLEVNFYSDKPIRAQTRILMCLEDNKHITTTIQVIADACQDIVSFHNLNESSQEITLDDDKGMKRKRQKGIMWLKKRKEKRGNKMDSGFPFFIYSILSPTGNCEVLSFGDCDINRTYQQSFMMTNHSSQVFKFAWNPAGQRVCFLPQVVIYIFYHLLSSV